MLFLSERDVWRCLPMDVAIDAMQDALIAIAGGDTEMPLRTQMGVGEHDGTLLLMPALVRGSGGSALAVKVVSVFGDNASRGMPVVNALVVAMDPETGAPQAIIEGGALTAVRTAAASGAATRALARQDARVLAILGAGVQAHAHVLAMSVVRDLHEIRIWSRRRERASDLADRLRQLDGITGRISVIDDADDAVTGAGIVCTTTPSRRALFHAGRIAPGTHINAVGAFQPDMQEVPDDCVAVARIFVDHMRSAMAEAGDLLGPMERGVIRREHIVSEVGELFAGKESGRRHSSEITLFKSVGNAAEDAIAASTALDAARVLGVGLRV